MAPVPVTVRAVAGAAPPDAFAIACPIDLSLIFTGLGPLPAVTGTLGQTGGWDHVGARRRPQLSDGTEAHEQLTAYAPPATFGYHVGGFTNLLGRLVSGADGTWRFRSAGERRTAIEWTYAFLPLPRRRWLVRLVVAPLWRRYMVNALGATVREIERRVGGR